MKALTSFPSRGLPAGYSVTWGRQSVAPATSTSPTSGVWSATPAYLASNSMSRITRALAPQSFNW